MRHLRFFIISALAILFTVGVLYADELERAISDYTRAIEINPRYAKAYNNRGNAYTDKGEYDLAISDYNKALEINPRDAGAYYNKALAYEKTGRVREAILAYKGFIANAPPQAPHTLSVHSRGYGSLRDIESKPLFKICPS